jgi:hypothetical protein
MGEGDSLASLNIPNNRHCDINELRRRLSKNHPSSVEEKYYEISARSKKMK